MAKGCEDQNATFEFLVSLMQEQKLAQVQPLLFSGFISAVYATEPSLARQIQEHVLEIPELKQHFVYLLGATPIAPWGARKLLEVASTGELEAWRFEQISYGRIHETISDSDLTEILEAINELDGGVFSTLEILGMRFSIDKASSYKPSDNLRCVGRDAILRLLSMHREEINKHRRHWIDWVIDECLSSSAPEEEIGEIVKLLCEGIETYRLYNYDVKQIVAVLIKNFPELLLNNVFRGGDKEKLLVHGLFKERVSRKEPSLNLISVDRMVKWCNGDEERIQAVADAISVYSSVDGVESALDNPKREILSTHARALLDVAENKLGVAEIIFKRTWPNSWTGSPAGIIEVRSKAFAELLEHSSLEVREFAKTKLAVIDQSVRQNRKQEAEENSRREQRFE